MLISILGRFWHNAKFNKVGTLIWLIFNKGLQWGPSFNELELTLPTNSTKHA